MTLGIDIVDLKDPLFQERNDRAFDLIKNGADVYIDHTYLFWILWAAKEAIFKGNREDIRFMPTQIPVKITQEKEEISFHSGNTAGKVIVTDEYILAICGELDFLTYLVFEKKGDNWSKDIRLMIMEYFRKQGHIYQMGSDNLNLPLIEPSKNKISISHHGRYGAVAFPKSLL